MKLYELLNKLEGLDLNADIAIEAPNASDTRVRDIYTDTNGKIIVSTYEAEEEIDPVEYDDYFNSFISEMEEAVDDFFDYVDSLYINRAR